MSKLPRQWQFRDGPTPEDPKSHLLLPEGTRTAMFNDLVLQVRFVGGRFHACLAVDNGGVVSVPCFYANGLETADKAIRAVEGAALAAGVVVR